MARKAFRGAVKDWSLCFDTRERSIRLACTDESGVPTITSRLQRIFEERTNLIETNGSIYQVEGAPDPEKAAATVRAVSDQQGHIPAFFVPVERIDVNQPVERTVADYGFFLNSAARCIVLLYARPEKEGRAKPSSNLRAISPQLDRVLTASGKIFALGGTGEPSEALKAQAAAYGLVHAADCKKSVVGAPQPGEP